MYLYVTEETTAPASAGLHTACCGECGARLVWDVQPDGDGPPTYSKACCNVLYRMEVETVKITRETVS